jgi:uncharacterized short protein YbdD (DUF466 family)
MKIHSAILNVRARVMLLRIWSGIREWCGDAAYERYIQSCARKSNRAALLSREEFYLSQVQRKYSQVSRCC